MLTRDALIRLCRARDLLRDVYHRPLSIRDVARDAGMSPYHFIRQFEALFGTAPHQSSWRLPRTAVGSGPW